MILYYVLKDDIMIKQDTGYLGYLYAFFTTAYEFKIS